MYVDLIEWKLFVLRFFVVFKLYKNYVVIFLWFKYDVSKNFAFLVGKEELLVVNVNGEVFNVIKDLEILDYKKDVVFDFKGEDDFENFDG